MDHMESICLIIPPSVFLLDERVFMSLGILRVAAVLEEAGYRVELLDLSGVRNYEEAARDHAAQTEAQVFGLTATTPQLPAATRVSHAIREVRSDARIILGGPHITLTGAARKLEEKRGVEGRATRAFEKLKKDFDILVAGDGEESIFAAISAARHTVIDADDPRSQMFLTNARLSKLPLPARHLVDAQSYHYSIEGIPAMSLIAQLGCPFECGFCGGRASPMLRRIRMRSVDSILAEILHLYTTYGAQGFMFYDDELNVNRKMVELMKALAKTAKELKTEFRLRGFVKSELFDDEQAQAMWEAGFRWILAGFESGSPRILENINKKATLEENTRCVEIARRHGLKVKALMSIGHPGESPQTTKETHDWLLRVKPEDFDVTIITPYPGSPYYDGSVPHESKPDVWVYTKDGDRLYSYEVDYSKVADYYKGNPNSGYTSYVFTDHLTAKQLVETRDYIERNVRLALGIPFNATGAAIQHEHSMGQSGAALPSTMLRTTPASRPAAAPGEPAPWKTRLQIALNSGNLAAQPTENESA